MPENQILRALGRNDLARLSPHLTEFSLKLHTVLYEVDAHIKEVYFVEAGMVSFLTALRDGGVIETGIVGSEGLIGSNLCLTGGPSLSQVIVQISGSALRMNAEEFIKAYETMPALHRLVNRHIGIMLFQAQQNSACQALHTVDGRLSRWLLQAQDVVKSDVVELTQEFLSHMIGAQRSTISVAANTLQAAGLIRYSRGRIQILNRAALEDCSCECYGAIREQVTKALAPPLL